jgi:hypothetical protein
LSEAAQSPKDDSPGQWVPLTSRLPPLQGLEIFGTVAPGRRSHTRFALGYYIIFRVFSPLNLNAQFEFISWDLAESQ